MGVRGREGKCRVQSQKKQEKMRPRVKGEGLSWGRIRTTGPLIDKGSKEKHETDKSVGELEWEKRFAIYKIYGKCLLNNCWENFVY